MADSQSTNDYIALAGFALAHAAWIVSDIEEGAVMVPFAMVLRAGERQQVVFEADTQEEALGAAYIMLEEEAPRLEGFALAREATMRGEGDTETDAIVIDAWSPDEPRLIVIAPLSGRGAPALFALTAAPMFVRDGDVLDGAHAGVLLQRLKKGARTHPVFGTVLDRL